MNPLWKTGLPLVAALLLTSCDHADHDHTDHNHDADHMEAEHHHEDEGEIAITPEQIRHAGIEVTAVQRGGTGALALPATIEGDPQRMQIVSAAIGGRVVALTRNLGQPIGRGQTLAIIESREAALLHGEIEAARARLALAETNLRREQRLFDQQVSAEQELIAARTAAAEARIALRQAQGQATAAGGTGGALNRLAVVAPLGGQVVSRTVVLGQTVAADAELFRVADLSRVAVSLGLPPADASKVRPGTSIDIRSGDRRSAARVEFISPILNASTGLATVIAGIDNRAGQWRVGEPVTAVVHLSGDHDDSALLVPQTAVQTVAGQPTVFVRTDHGFQATPVALGATNGDKVIVTSGLTGNEQIAAAGSFTLKAELGKGEAEHVH